MTQKQFADIMKKRNRPIKSALMDQENIAGLGNIYADESLYAAGIRPSIKAMRLSRPRLMRLHEMVIKVLHKAINNRGTSVDDYLDGYGRSGNFQNLLQVYGKTNQPCPHCSTPIKRIAIGGRSTHYCPRCQK
jgi:formamidopyrimidine-DNA glycosylase